MPATTTGEGAPDRPLSGEGGACTGTWRAREGAYVTTERLRVTWGASPRPTAHPGAARWGASRSSVGGRERSADCPVPGAGPETPWPTRPSPPALLPAAGPGWQGAAA